ncbi:Cyclic di-GMP phosphodiesterase Gmr [compost metagenome]
MGCGMWSMHFIGMLATSFDMVVRYDIPTTILSALAGMVASFIAFSVTADPQSRLWRLGLGGLFMGSGIVAMHVIGMKAMHTSAAITYDPVLYAVSALIAVGAAYAALLLFRQFRQSPDFSRWKLISSIVLGLAICGMHYTAMAAMQLDHSVPMHVDPTRGGDPQLFILESVTLVTFFILLISWGAIFFDRHVLERMAYSDALTGLSNRHDLVRFFEQKFTVSNKGALLFIDLDRFKTINDTLGHDVGDLLLNEVSVRLRQCMGDKETVFRLGGDEFVIVSTDGAEAPIYAMAERILDAIKRPYHIDDNELYVTASIGISFAPRHGTDRSSLMKAADTAMYNAKNLGKNCLSVFDTEMDRLVVRRMELEKDMRKALAHQEFFVVYQPKCDSSTNEIVGMEALLRWQHPNLGMISPVEFIPIAEETNLIVPITHWILKEVCKQNKLWQDIHTRKIAISVNMSVRVFESQMLMEIVTESLQAAALEAKYLELEITESIAMNQLADTHNQLKHIRELGVQVSLDDFGTGYSSLGSLDEIPVDTLKIDQVFIRKSANPSKQAIISSMITLAHNLNLKIVAEGVETMDQIEFLKSQGCYIMQGYYYGKPMIADDIDMWLHKSDVS